MLRFYIYVFVFMFSQSALSALDDCPASSGVISAGNGYCIVSSVTTGTKIRLNFSTGFDSATLIEDDITAPTKTDAVYASHGITLSKAVDVAEASALASKASGNNGETVGAQRKISFIKAAEIIADQIVSTETIIVDAQFTNLDCSANQAVLGSASATSFMYAASAPVGADDNTWYPVGLYNALSGIDNYPSSGSITNYANNPGSITADSDLFTSYNYASGTNNCLEISNGWYYGFDAPPSEVYQDGMGNHLVDADNNPLAITYIGFTTVLLHEMLHGLGFSSLTYSDGSKFSSKEDIYSNFLYSAADSATWQGNTLSNGQRQSSGISDTGLLWSGANVNAQAIGQLTAGFQNNDGDPAFNSGDKVQMYAPNPAKSGSSISHFNTAASPNEIMEPQYTAGSLDIGLALYLLKDIGWDIVVPSSNTAPTITAADQSTNEDAAEVVDASSWGSDTDGDALTYSINSVCATNITCSINSDGTSLTMTPAADHNGGTHVITVSVSDGKGGSASDTFNLNVIAQNDDPNISGIPNQSIKVGEYKDLDVSTFSADVDGDGLTYSTTACGANLTCTFQDATTLRVAAGAGVGSTVSVTVKVDDSNSGINTDTFDVSIVTAIPSTTIEVGGSTHNDGDTFILSDNSTQINVNNGSGNYSYSLDYNSSNVTGLIAENTAGLTIGLPATGEFAGDYTLTITDNGDGDVVTLIVTRPLRLSWSTKALLNDDMSQTLKVEGGAAGTVYSIVQSGSADLIFRDGSGASITTATAANDAEAFNSAMVQLDSLDVADISYMDVTVQSSYEDVIETDVKVYPSSLHHFTVENDLNEALVGALATLDGNELLLRELNLVNNFSTDTHGEFTVLLPDTSVLPASESYAMTISATGYTPATLVLSSENTAHKVVLTELVNGISINGEISAGGNQNLLLQVPVVIITYDDGTTEAIAVSVSLATQASFSLEVDLNAKSLSLLSISQAESVTVDLDMSNVSQSQNLEVFLLNNISVVATRPVDTGDTGSAAGGSLIWFNLFLFGVLLASRLLLKRAKMKVCI